MSRSGSHLALALALPLALALALTLTLTLTLTLNLTLTLTLARTRYDPDYLHCYPASFDGKPPPHTGSGAPPPRAQDTCTTLAHVIPFPNSSRELPGSPIAAPGGASGDGTPTCCGACNAQPYP